MTEGTRRKIISISIGDNAYGCEISELEALELIRDLIHVEHYRTLSDSITESLLKIRELRSTGEPMHSDREVIHSLVEEVIYWRSDDYNRQMTEQEGK